MKRTRKHAPLAALGATLIVWSPLVLASGAWSTYQHDYQRTGRADGNGAMSAPAIQWTQALGGQLHFDTWVAEAAVEDLDGDGVKDVAAISGGRVVATSSAATQLWRGAFDGPKSILGAWDLDGSGWAKVVVDTGNQVEILDGKDGHVVATLPDGVLTQANFFPGPSKGGVLVVASSRGVVSGYDFSGGIGSAPTAAWTFTGGFQTAYLVGDVDGGGKPQIVRPLEDGFEVRDPVSGSVLYQLAGMSATPAYFYFYQLANVDGVPGDEIIAIDTSYIYSPPTGIYVAGVRAGRLTTLWSSTASPSVAHGNDYYTVAGAAADIDGDGSGEVIYSAWDGTTGAWTTTIADGGSGSPLGSISGEVVVAVADIDGDGKQEIVTRSSAAVDRTPPRSTLHAYDFDSRSAGSVAKSWSIANAHVLFSSWLVTRGAWAWLDVPIVADFDSSVPGAELLVGQDEFSRHQDTQLATVNGSTGAFAATKALTGSMQGIWFGDRLTSSKSTSDLILYSDDGIARIQSHSLADTASFAAGSYSNWLTTIPNSTSNGVAATSSSAELLVLDGTHLGVDGRPLTLARMAHAQDTTAAAGAGYPFDPVAFVPGTPALIVATQVFDGITTLVAMDPTGVENWRYALSSGVSSATPGPMVVDTTGKGALAVLATLGFSSGSNEGLALIDARAGKLLRSTPLDTAVTGADEIVTGALIDVNGDSILDLVAPIENRGIAAINLAADPMDSLWVADTVTGSIRAYNGTVVAANLSGGATSDLLRVDGNNGFGPYLRLGIDGTIATSADQGLPTQADYDRNSIALVQRSAGSSSYDLVSTGTRGAGSSRVRRVAGADLSTMWTVYASSGNVSTAVPAAAYSLSDPIEIDVNGDGEEEVVFGSGDGFLYALKSTDGSKVFAMDLGAPVDHVIASNVDRDPQLELVASLKDGRLVALDDPGKYDAQRDEADAGTDGGLEGGMDSSFDSSVDADARPDSPADVADAGGGADASADGGGGGPGTTDSSGCGCRTVGGSSGIAGHLGGALGMVFVLLGLRRRRRSL